MVMHCPANMVILFIFLKKLFGVALDMTKIIFCHVQAFLVENFVLLKTSEQEHPILCIIDNLVDPD